MAVITITKDNFQKEVIEASVPVLLDFWATWCGPCRMIAPVVEEVEKSANGAFKVGKVNVDDEPELAQSFRIAVIPTLVVVKDGKIVNQTTGVQSKEAILALLS